MKRKILIDLDVLTLAFWDNKDPGKIIERIKRGEFELYTPYLLLDILSKWRHKTLAEKIKNFYSVFSSKIITSENIIERKSGAEIETLTKELIKIGIKEEDISLILVTSIFDLDYLVTFNRKHLYENTDIINEVLSKNGFSRINIKLPDEI